MKRVLELIKYPENSPHWKVKTPSGKIIGGLALQDDGLYQWEQSGYGYLAAHNLREIADLLDEVNEPYNKQIDEYFKNSDNK